jgi:hypothetical protein
VFSLSWSNLSILIRARTRRIISSERTGFELHACLELEGGEEVGRADEQSGGGTASPLGRPRGTTPAKCRAPVSAATPPPDPATPPPDWVSHQHLGQKIDLFLPVTECGEARGGGSHARGCRQRG